jgi:hypothetical protein
MSKRNTIIYDDENDNSLDEYDNIYDAKIDKSESKLENQHDIEIEFKSDKKLESKLETTKSRRKPITITKIKSNETTNKISQHCPNCEINHELLYLIRDLSDKLTNVENELQEIKQIVKIKTNNSNAVLPPINKKNIMDWLNNYIVPTMTFDEFVENIVVNMGHFEFLVEYKLTDTIQKIIQTNIVKNEDIIYPLYSTIEKSGKVYVFNEHDSWEVITIEYLSKFVKQIENKLSQYCIEWKNRYSGKNNFNSELQDRCQHAILKLCNISYTQDCTMNRVRYDLCAQLKTVCK